MDKQLKLYIRKLINEQLEDALMDKTIKNPETGRDIKIRTALSYDEKSKVHQTAKAFLNKSKKDNSKDESGKPKSKVAQLLSNTANKAKKGIYNAIGKSAEKVGTFMQKIALAGDTIASSDVNKTFKKITTIATVVGVAAGAVLALTTETGRELGQKLFQMGKHTLLDEKLAESFSTVKTMQAMGSLGAAGAVVSNLLAGANVFILGMPGSKLEDYGKNMRDKADKINISDSYNRNLNEEAEKDNKKMVALLTNHITDIHDEDIELMKDLVKKGVIDDTGELDKTKLEQYYNQALEDSKKQNENKRLVQYVDNKIKSYLSESKSKTYTIYKATNKKNGKVYIGQTSMDYDLRLERHRIRSKNGEGNKFHKALKYFGFDNFSWRKLYETTSKKEADEKEYNYIKKYKSVEEGYNSTRGRKLIKEKD